MFFPPQADGIIKIAAVHFVTNYAPSHPSISLLRYRSGLMTDGIPKAVEDKMRKWMKEVIPELADRKWDDTRICWFVAPSFMPVDSILADVVGLVLRAGTEICPTTTFSSRPRQSMRTSP